jgi:hypothetical protein
LFKIIGHAQERQRIDIGALRTLERLIARLGPPETLVTSPLLKPERAAPPPPAPPGPTKLGGLKEAKRDIVEAAKTLRTELSQTFPGARFCVNIERYSGGESIRVNWVDGPSSETVDAILKKYEDIDYDPYSGEILSGGNRYVSGQRRYSGGRFDAAKAEYERTHTGYAPYQPQDEAWRTLARTDFYPQPSFKCVRGIPVTPGGEFF